MRDRVRHRFEVTFHEIDDDDHPGRQTVVLSTAGNNRRVISTIFDQIRQFVEGSPYVVPSRVDLEVFPWHPPEQHWLIGGFGSEE